MNYRDKDLSPRIIPFTPMDWFAKWYKPKGYGKMREIVYKELNLLELV